MDITVRLRAAANILDKHPGEAYALNANCRSAADEIERLRAALDPFAKHAHATEHIVPNNLKTWCENARETLNK